MDCFSRLKRGPQQWLSDVPLSWTTVLFRARENTYLVFCRALLACKTVLGQTAGDRQQTWDWRCASSEPYRSSEGESSYSMHLGTRA